MGGKPKDESPKRAPKKKMTPEEQSALFIETARALGVDETGEEFERAFNKITSTKSGGDRQDTPHTNVQRASKHRASD